MRIVKLSDLSEEEKQSVLEQQRSRIERNNSERESLQEEANKEFNNIQTNNNTNKNTTSYRDILSAIQSEEQKKMFKKNNNLNVGGYLKTGTSSIWSKILTGNGILQTPDNFKDGYQFGDIAKTTAGTIGDLGLSIIKGTAEIGGNIGKLGAAGVAQVADWTGNTEKAEQIRNKLATKEDPVSKILNNIQEKTNKSSVAGDVSDKIAGSLGYIGGITAASSIGLGNAAIFGSAAGGATSEAYKNENVKDWQAWTKIIGTGGIEYITERLFGLFGTSGLDKGIANAISSKISSGAGKLLARTGIQATGEAVEEFLSYVGGQGLDLMIDKIDSLTGNDGAKFKQELNWEEVGEQMAIAFLASGVLGAGTSAKSVIDNKNSNTTWKEAINSTGRQMDIQSQTEDLNNEIDNIEKKLSKEKDTSKIKDLTNEIKWKKKQLNALENNLQEKIESEQNQKNSNTNIEYQDADNEKINNLRKETDNKVTETEIKMTQNGLAQENMNQQNNANIQQSDGIGTTKTNINYMYEKSDNVKIDNLRKDASNYWNNTDKTKSLVNTIEKVITDKNYNVRLDDSIKNSNGQSVNAQIKTLENGEIEIKINPNAKNVGEFLLTHEITHAIETQEIKDLIIEHASKNQEFNKALESLKQTYETDDVSSEVVADISGQLLGNQEFINNLSVEKPNVFKRIYNKIIELANKITGNSNEALFIKDLKNKWEEAYRTQNNNLDNNTYFSEKYNNDGSLNSIKINENIFEDTQGKSIKKTIKEYLTKHIGEYYNIIESGQKVYLGEELPNEYAYSEYSKKLPTNKLLAKGRAVTNLQEIIENATNRQWNKNRKAKHNMDAKYGFYKYDTKFSFDVNGNEQTYSGTILIRNDANGKKYLYDILDIKKVGNNLPSVASDSKESSYRDGSNSLPTSSILPMNKKINGNIKYSMQESENNSVFFNSPKNKQARLDELKAIDTSEMGLLEKNKIKKEIRALDQGYNSVKEYEKAENEKVQKAKEEYQKRQLKKNIEEISKKQKVQDNKGRTLSEEQHEYFKNSKVRDENGNLKVLYHGTDAEFNVFDYKYLGKNGTSLGKGFYLTDDINTAKGYAERGNGRIMEVYANIEKPLSYGKTTITSNEYIKFIEAVNEATDGQLLGDYSDGEKIKKGDAQYKGMLAQFREDYKYGGDDIDLISEILNSANLSLKNGYKILKESLGYDGIISNKGFLTEDGTVYVPFLSEQIKNVDNINPTSNPDIRYSKNNQTWQEYIEDNFKSTGTRTDLQDIKLPTAQDIAKSKNKEKFEFLTDEDYSVLNKIYEKQGRTEILTDKKKANILEKYANDKYAIKESLDIMAQKFINKGHYIDKLSKEAKNPELKFIYDKNLNSFAEAQYVIGVAQTDNKGNKIGKSINDIWEPIENSGLTKEFSEYLLHKHNIDRSEHKKYVFGKEIGPAESTAKVLEIEKRRPEFKKYAEEIKKFNHNNLKNLKEAGLLTQDTIDYIENMYPNYVTISRNIEGNSYIGNEERVGSNAPLKKATGGNSDIQPIKDAMAEQVIRIKRLINQNELGKELAKTLKNANIDEGVDIQLSPSLLLDIETMVDTDNKGNKYYIYFENGNQKKLKINDNLYESLRPTEISKVEKTLPLKAVQKITNMHRSLLTSSNPIFVVTNFFKDFQDGMFNSKYSSKFIKNYGKALNEIYTHGKYYESYMANGGMTNTYFDYNEGVKKKSNKFVEKIRNVNEIVEQLPRLSEFISTLEDGKSLNEALYNAAEITTNFKRGGDITKIINRNGVNFLNASVQGLDKQFRNFSGQNGAKGYANLLAKVTIMGIVPAILNHMLLDDDDDYQDLPQSTKDLYYLFKYDDGKFIRIPKGRVLSIFGAAARRTLEAEQGQEDAWKGFGNTIVNQIAPNNPLEDNILAPITQVKNNKTWYGSDLVSSRLQKELPKNQYDETTDEFSKWLGSKLNTSPKKINYLIDQYSGGVGDVVLPMITPQAKENVLVDKFTTDSILKNKNVSKFYETLEKQNQIVNDSFATDEDKLQQKYLSEVSSKISDLYKEKRNIQMQNISNKDKKEQVRAIQEKINELSENALENYSKGIYKKNSAKIDDIEYYKSSEGKWMKLTEEEKEKNKDISIETYATYKQKIYEETQNQRNSGKLENNQSLKNKDKIQILLDSNYSNKEIKAIYENYIKSETDKEYSILEKFNIGNNIKEYLKYKQQDFESDYEDDGTEKGKAISGSKQKKVYDYVNKMNITYSQRLLLLGTQYKLSDSERSKVFSIVDNSNLKAKEKLDIFKSLKGFTVYKNGNVSY